MQCAQEGPEWVLRQVDVSRGKIGLLNVGLLLRPGSPCCASSTALGGGKRRQSGRNCRQSLLRVERQLRELERDRPHAEILHLTIIEGHTEVDEHVELTVCGVRGSRSTRIPLPVPPIVRPAPLGDRAGDAQVGRNTGGPDLRASGSVVTQAPLEVESPAAIRASSQTERHQ